MIPDRDHSGAGLPGDPSACDAQPSAIRRESRREGETPSSPGFPPASFAWIAVHSQGGICWPSALILAVALLLPVLVRGQNLLQWTTNYYTIAGTNLTELRQSINATRPWKDKSNVDGMTTWQVAWKFSLTPSGGVWRCRSLATRTTITTTLPRWTPPPEAPTAVVGVWGRYRAALARHEAGHAGIAMAAALEMHKRVKEAGDDADSSSLKKKLDDLIRQIMADYRERDRAYDESTGHGGTQGALLPRSIHGSESLPER